MKHENHICEEDSMVSSTNLQIWVPWRYPKMYWKESLISELSNSVFESCFIILEAKMKPLSNSKIFDEFHSKLFYFSSCSLEKNTPEFRMVIFYFRINSCVETLKWRAIRHSKAENRNFVPRKCECPLGNIRGLLLNMCTTQKTLEKHEIFILMRYLGTRRCHDGTQNFLKKSLVIQL